MSEANVGWRLQAALQHGRGGAGRLFFCLRTPHQKDA